MAQTKHRSVRVDTKNGIDEVEQAMHVKARRAMKKSVNVEFDIDDEFADTGYEDLAQEVEYFLKKYD